MMDDLISRQAALDCVTYDVEYTTERIKALPSLQPTCNQLATDVISRQAAIDALKDAENHAFNSFYQGLIKAHKIIADLPSVQPETAKRIVGKSKDGMTLWYQCDMCNEPVDAQDNFCRGCGRRLTDG
jgi:hypothetical protein